MRAPAGTAATNGGRRLPSDGDGSGRGGCIVPGGFFAGVGELPSWERRPNGRSKVRACMRVQPSEGGGGMSGRLVRLSRRRFESAIVDRAFREPASALGKRNITAEATKVNAGLI
jgi:hypothetical protein